MSDDWRDDMKWFYTAVGRFVCDRLEDPDAVIADLPSEVEKRRRCWSFGVYGDCESPIEAILFANLLFATDGYREIKFDAFPGSGHATVPEIGTVFSLQQKIGQYRVDFMFTAHVKGRERLLAVECDGHDFHERTKEQAARDKSRDRALVTAGVQVMRFTGSEIYRDALKAVGEIEVVLMHMIDDLMAEAERG